MGLFGGIGHLASEGWDDVKHAPGDAEQLGKSTFHATVKQVKSEWDTTKHVAGDVGHASEVAWHGTVAAAEWTERQAANPNSVFSQLGHTALDAVGEVPVVGTVSEGLNTVWYAGQGDYVDAGISAAAAIPGVGEGVDALKLTKDAVHLAEGGKTLVRDVKDGENIVKDARSGEALSKDASDVKPREPAGTGGGHGAGDAEGPHNADGAGPSDHAGGGGGGSGPGGTKGSGGPTGDVYSVGYEMTLDPASYPGHSRGAHFKEANESLLKAMEGDPDFAQGMQDLGVNVQRTPTGTAPRRSPADWTWHHAQEPGTMQLVPRDQHKPGSIFQKVLHPDGKGGYAKWGK